MMHTRLLKKIGVGLLLAALLVSSATAETVTYLHTDLLGSVVLETDQNRNVVARYEYEPYGLPRQATADAPGYTGHVHDAGSGLVYMQQRYYDPEVGQFLSVDPVGVDLATGANFNRYWYGNDNPYRYVDPDGRVPVLVAAAVFAWRAYSAYDTVTSAAENISTLADADVSLSDKALAGLELVASALGGKFGRESTENVVRATKGADGPSDGARFIGDSQGNIADTMATPRGSYDQPGGGRTDILQREDHGAGFSHTHDPVVNTDPSTGESFINGMEQPGRPVSAEDVRNIESGAAPRSSPKGR